MLLEIIGWLYGVSAIMSLVYIVVWNVGRFCKSAKCRKVKNDCGWSECCFNVCCVKCGDIPISEEIQVLCTLLEENKKNSK